MCDAALTDRMQDRTTLNRALAERLFLLVRLKGQQEWNLPLQAWDGKKAMREVSCGVPVTSTPRVLPAHSLALGPGNE